MQTKGIERLKEKLKEDDASRKEATFLSRDLLELAMVAAASSKNPKLSKAVTIGSAALTVGTLIKDIWKFYRRNASAATFTIKIMEDDAIFDIVEDWFMEALPEYKQRSIFAHSTIKKDPKRGRGMDSGIPLEASEDDEKKKKDRVDIGYSFDGTIVQSLDIAGFSVDVWTSVPEQSAKSTGSGKNLIQRSINIVCKTVEARNAVLAEIEKQSQHLVKTQPRLFVSSKWGHFNKRAYIQPRSRESVILKEGQMERIMDYLHSFLENKAAYTKTDIPYRTGILLYGEPGSGKSSTALAIANELRMNVFIISLTALDSDEALGECFGSIPPDSIIILEDIDIAHAVKDRDGDDTRGVTMTGMLNVLDGFQSPPGVITIMTTNRLDVLDSAIIRPGRVDLMEELNCLDDYQLDRMCEYFIGSVPETLPSITPADGITSAEIMGEVRKHLPDFENAADDIVDFVQNKVLTARAA
jgi:hypothetical protein